MNLITSKCNFRTRFFRCLPSRFLLRFLCDELEFSWSMELTSDESIKGSSSGFGAGKSNGDSVNFNYKIKY